MQLTNPMQLQTQTASVQTLLYSVLLLFAVLFSSAAQARPLDDILDAKEITIFVYSDYAPYSWEQEEGEYRGIDVEIAHALGERLGVEVSILMRGADENLDDDLRVNIWKGDLIYRKVADVMMHVPYDPEVNARNELAVLMAPYFQEKMAVVVDRNTLPELETFGRFLTSEIGVEVDTAGDFFLSNAFRGQLHKSIKRGRTFADAADMYISGEVPALLASRAQSEWVATQAAQRDSYIAQPPMPGIVRTGWPIGIAVKHDSRDLGYELENQLSQMQSAGELAAIYQRYGVKYQPPELE